MPLEKITVLSTLIEIHKPQKKSYYWWCERDRNYIVLFYIEFLIAIEIPSDLGPFPSFGNQVVNQWKTMITIGLKMQITIQHKQTGKLCN